jgi:hypothetical protein
MNAPQEKKEIKIARRSQPKEFQNENVNEFM